MSVDFGELQGEKLLGSRSTIATLAGTKRSLLLAKNASLGAAQAVATLPDLKSAAAKAAGLGDQLLRVDSLMTAGLARQMDLARGAGKVLEFAALHQRRVSEVERLFEKAKLVPVMTLRDAASAVDRVSSLGRRHAEKVGGVLAGAQPAQLHLMRRGVTASSSLGSAQGSRLTDRFNMSWWGAWRRDAP
ncbi:hypothetical protein [Streptomyces sp. NPDC055056]